MLPPQHHYATKPSKPCLCLKNSRKLATATAFGRADEDPRRTAPRVIYSRPGQNLVRLLTIRESESSHASPPQHIKIKVIKNRPFMLPFLFLFLESGLRAHVFVSVDPIGVYLVRKLFRFSAPRPPRTRTRGARTHTRPARSRPGCGELREELRSPGGGVRPRGGTTTQPQGQQWLVGLWGV